LQDFHEGALVADSPPDSPMLASTAVTSLWQSNLAAIVVERLFCAVNQLATCRGCSPVSYHSGVPQQMLTAGVSRYDPHQS
jgi:hypothetical protein